METIKQLITDGKTDEAIRLLDEYIEKNTSSDEAYYLSLIHISEPTRRS